MDVCSIVRVSRLMPHRFGMTGLVATLCTVVIGLGAPRAVAAMPPPQKQEVRAFRDITYYEVRDDPDAARHRLDVYRPEGKGPYPVLLLLHGGGWVAGGKDDVFGMYGYGTIARCLAERGLVVVLPNYRLSPGVRHPEHVKDVARAFAWAYGHCKDYRGDPRQLFVSGHSAGGHLAALLAADETYLKEVGRSAKDIRGVIGVAVCHANDVSLVDRRACRRLRVPRQPRVEHDTFAPGRRHDERRVPEPGNRECRHPASIKFSASQRPAL